MGSILITGCNCGIGLELAKVFAEMSWRVFATCRNPDEADELQKLSSAHPLLSVHALDVTDAGQRERLAAELRDLPVDILLNNAGIYGPKHQGFGETDVDGWLRTLQVNSIAPLQMVESFVENVARSKRKIVASIGSMMGSLSDNTSGGHYAYRTSKAAVHMVMKGLASDLAPREIISVVFHPGWVKTRLGGDRAPLSVQESATWMARVLLGLEPSDNGKFFDFSGAERPW